MKLTSCFCVFALLLVLWLGAAPAWGVNKDMVQLQTQVQQLQEQMTAMQRSFDERMGVMKNLVEQDTDAVNKVATALNASAGSTLQKQQGDSRGEDRPAFRADSGAERHHGRNQGAPGQGEQATGRHAGDAAESGARSRPRSRRSSRPWPRAPPPDVLYNNGLRDYNGGKNDLATQEFSDYIKFYPNTDLAGTAYFYLGEIQFRQGNYQQAAQSYDQVLQNFPSGNKAASAQLKKGFALIELGKQDDGVSGSCGM